MSTPIIRSLREFIYGSAPRPVTCGHGLIIGGGDVIPELNFTLPPMLINEQTWPEVRSHYSEMVEAGHAAGQVKIPPREQPWIERMETALADIPESEDELIEEMIPVVDSATCALEEYGISAAVSA